MKKFVRTPNAIKEVLCKIDYQTFKELGYKISDSCENLCDAFIAENNDGTRDTYKFFNDTIGDLIKNGVYVQAFYGAIWVKGEHDEPILKPVMKYTNEGWKLL